MKILAFIIAVPVVVSVVWITLRDSRADIQPLETGNPEEMEPTPRDIPEGAREFAPDRIDISFLYPDVLTVEDYVEVDGSHTFVFQNVEQGLGIQLYITPYGNTQITPEQFKTDVPTGVRKEEVTVTVDGVRGVKFYSLDENLGETVEIWFIHGGRLYELTTVKALETLAMEIIQTWKFI
jgi:hypothetical protein